MKNRSSNFLLMIPVIVLSTTMVACSEDGDKGKKSGRRAAPVKVDDAEEGEDAEAFEVPQGTPDELFAFINKVKQTAPKERTQESVKAHLQRQVSAVILAVDAILGQDVEEDVAVRAVEEKFQGLNVLSQFDDSAADQLTAFAKELVKDKRPQVARIGELHFLQVSAGESLQGSAADQKQMAKRLFEFAEKQGLDYRIAGLIASFGEALQNDNPPLAGDTLVKLGNAMKASDDSLLSEQAEAILGTARFINLPGNFLDLRGVNADGKEFDWDSYRGKVVLVDFWATWCGPCRAEVPNVLKNLKKYGDKGFAVVGVNLDRDRADFDEYIAEAELPWDNIMPDSEGNSEMAVHYGIKGIPTVILVDRKGNVISTEARGRELGRLLEKIFGPVEDEAEKEKEEE